MLDQFIQPLEKSITSLIRQKREKSFFESFVLFCLWIFSQPFKLAIFLRNTAFNQGWFSSYDVPVPVVSIGNIVAGGTGKTPITQLLAKELSKDIQIAILARGYRSKIENQKKPYLLSEGEGPLALACVCGDEPYLLAQNLPTVYVIVGKNRRLSSEMAVDKKAQLILLDDGMQHRSLARDFEIVVINCKDPFGQNYYLPRGFLRDHPDSLKRASLIVLTHTNRGNLLEIKQEIRQYSSAPLVETVIKITDIWNKEGEAVDLKGKKVAAFCGIANPDSFIDLLEKEGLEVVNQLHVADHATIDEDVLMQFALDSAKKGAFCLLCTEKDWVKLSSLEKLPLFVCWVEIFLKIKEGRDEWQTLIGQIKDKVIR